MNAALTVVGIIGGVLTIFGAAFAIIRNIVRNVSATEDNTKATHNNTDAIAVLTHKVEELGSKVDGVYLRQAIQGERLSLIERKMGTNGRS
jgi:hypothetical protein